MTPDTHPESAVPCGPACTCAVNADEPPRAGPVRRIQLTELRAGQTGRISESGVETDDAALLRAMGLRLNSVVRLCRVGEPCIVTVVDQRGCCCRIGLARPLAQRLLVTVGD